MTGGEPPEPDPFDLALVEHFAHVRDARGYTALVQLGADAGARLPGRDGRVSTLLARR